MVSAALSLLPPTACCEKGPLLTSSSSSGWAPLFNSSRVLGRRRNGCAGAIRFTRIADLQSHIKTCHGCGSEDGTGAETDMETRLNTVLQGMACDKNKVSGT